MLIKVSHFLSFFNERRHTKAAAFMELDNESRPKRLRGGSKRRPSWSNVDNASIRENMMDERSIRETGTKKGMEEFLRFLPFPLLIFTSRVM